MWIWGTCVSIHREIRNRSVAIEPISLDIAIDTLGGRVSDLIFYPMAQQPPRRQRKTVTGRARFINVAILLHDAVRAGSHRGSL